MTLIDGKSVAKAVKQEIAAQVEAMVAAGKRRPHLAGVLVGHDGGSESYMANKVKSCAECGFKSSLLRFEDTVSEEELLATVNKLNNDPDVRRLRMEKSCSGIVRNTVQSDTPHPYDQGDMDCGRCSWCCMVCVLCVCVS